MAAASLAGGTETVRLRVNFARVGRSRGGAPAEEEREGRRGREGEERRRQRSGGSGAAPPRLPWERGVTVRCTVGVLLVAAVLFRVRLAVAVGYRLGSAPGQDPGP